jgi:cation transport ATPase
MTDDLRRLPLTIRLARRTRATVHQNVLVGVGLSIGFVWLASMGVFGPILGGLLHFVGELFVIFNSARLLAFAQPRG